jgi:nucleoside-diphosphate-sugar epimerase
MKIIVTGASGFLGKICMPVLLEHHEVIRVGRSSNNEIIADITTGLLPLPPCDVVVHAAGKAHVYPKTEAEVNAFYDVNVSGTQTLLNALDKEALSGFVFISSVSVYGLEQGEEVDETTQLRGTSPYASSKIQAEALITSWCLEHGVDYLILRLPLIAGAKPLGNLGKMMLAIQRRRYVRIARGDAQKSMVLASDVAQLIDVWISKQERVSGIFNLTDGVHPSFYQLEEGLKLLFKIKYLPAIPMWLGNALGKLGDRFSWFPVNSATIRKITGTFTFSDKKARTKLGWNPRSVLANLDELL